nr:hypothetical protein GCM10020092_070550 [Actinoplanes digitatis]
MTFVRSPIITNPVSGPIANGSSPLNRVAPVGAAIARGAVARTASAIRAMCSGEVPQQPPTMLTRPDAANSATRAAVSSGVWS